MTILITGANGFIGKSLCERMLKEKWHVREAVRDSKYLEKLPVEVDVVQIESI